MRPFFRLFILDVFARFVSKGVDRQLLEKMDAIRSPLVGCEYQRGNGDYIYAAPYVMCVDISWLKLEGLKLKKVGHPLNYIKSQARIKDPQALDLCESLNIKAINDNLPVVYLEHYKKKSEGYSYYFLNKKVPIIQYAGRKNELIGIWKRSWNDGTELTLHK